MKMQTLTLRNLIIISSLVLIPVAVLILTGCSGPSDKSPDLEAGFVSPPDQAKPLVWWHWMNGNISKQGIRDDLEWMHRIGIGGFQTFDAALATPQIVEKRLVYMTPEWKDAFKFATDLADSLNLEMAIAGSPGWSESGGPWVRPEQGMKKYVWSETPAEGGKPFSGKVPAPPSTTGIFQNLGPERSMSNTVQEQAAPIEFYADAAVIAFRLPEAEKTMAELKPKVTSSGGTFTLAMLTDGDLAKSEILPSAYPGENAWIQYEFAQPVTMKGLSIVGSLSRFAFGGDVSPRTLEVSDDGLNFSKVVDIPPGSIAQKTMSFAPATGKYFRFNWLTPTPNPLNMDGTVGPGIASALAELFGITPDMLKSPAGISVAELVLYTAGRVNRFEDKAGFATPSDLYAAATPEAGAGEVVSKADVVDLTRQMLSDGTLEWTPPEGRWIIMRLGYSLTGRTNHPASPEATGLEVDKLNAADVKAYFTNYLDQYEDATLGLMGNQGLEYIITDSYEAGSANWTLGMMEEFKTRRGYDMTTWIPVLSGHIVESAVASDAFLWDFRRTLADLIAENHYDQLTTILQERDMGRYTESHESGRAFVGDGMEVKRTADIPMSATWTPGGFGGFGETEVAIRYRADVRESASVSHLYGQQFVAAESMTAIGTAWAWSPETLKPTADMEMANGVNRFVIHCSPHQPVNDKIPGLGLGPFGQWFTRHETWSEEAVAWITYLARSSYMLQQGKFVADVVWFYGEDNNVTALFGEKLPDVPEGYNYDFVNADALVNILDVKKGLITSPSGMSYKLLALDANSRYMTLPVLKKIDEMVSAGAVVVGDKPIATPSLSDDNADFELLSDHLWPEPKGEFSVGKGKVYAGMTVSEALDAMNIEPDFIYTKLKDDTYLMYVHRNLGGTDIYWVNNRNTRVEDLEADFRVSGREAELWHPETGLREPASFTIEDGRTKVPLHLEANDAVFVVFRTKTGEKSRIVPAAEEQKLTGVEGPWDMKFQEKRGAPAEVTFEKLTPWNESEDPGIKYFSGKGTYTKTINAPPDWFKEGSELWLDLGSVKNIAEVLINGESAGIVWKTPFMINLTGKLKEGDNIVQINVINLWVNRLIGDTQPGVTEKITFTTMPFYKANSPLRSAGLLGPVQIISKTVQN